MKEGHRFVDCDMHIMEPIDLFDKLSRPGVQGPRHLLAAPGRRRQHRHARPPLVVLRRRPAQQRRQYLAIQPHPRAARLRAAPTTNVMFAVERGYDAEAQVMGMEMEGIDIAVLFPTVGLSFLGARQHGPAILRRDLPGLQRLAARFLRAQPRPAEDGGDAADPRRQPRLPGAAPLRQGIRRGRRLRAAQLRQRPLLALDLLGPALQHCCRRSTCRCAFTRAPGRTIRRSSRALAKTASCAMSPATRPRCSWR